jgi:hypothetical protein
LRRISFVHDPPLSLGLSAHRWKFTGPPQFPTDGNDPVGVEIILRLQQVSAVFRYIVDTVSPVRCQPQLAAIV